MNTLEKKSQKAFQDTIAHLSIKKKVLLLTTSNRWSGEKGGEIPKSTQLAYEIQTILGEEKISIIDITKLNIYPCEGNVSTQRGNTCGEKKAQLKDVEKNPSGEHRCWASLNNYGDELWKVSKALLESDAVILFGSIRRGSMNSYYQKLIERLTWLENRHSTLEEENILEKIEAGIIIVNQNWRGKEVLETQKEILSFYGFQTPEVLSWNWQFLEDSHEETQESYRQAVEKFQEIFLLKKQ